MPNTQNRLLYILNLLHRESDEEQPITITQILERLEKAGIEGNRRTVAHDLEVLSDNGFDVICNKSRQNQYFIGERHFEIPELKLLVDAVQASRFISIKRSKRWNPLPAKRSANMIPHTWVDLPDRYRLK